MENVDLIDDHQIAIDSLAFIKSKVLLIASKLELFTYLSAAPQSVSAIMSKFKLHERAVYDFLDTLVAMGYLNRSGIKRSSIYSNSELSEKYLVKGKENYKGCDL